MASFDMMPYEAVANLLVTIHASLGLDNVDRVLHPNDSARNLKAKSSLHEVMDGIVCHSELMQGSNYVSSQSVIT